MSRGALHPQRWTLAAACVGALALAAPAAASAKKPFVGGFSTTSTVASTVPANGDLNPYGTAVVPRSTGRLTRGDVLVSNFNNATNLQGTGTTIVEIAPGGKVRLFARIDSHTCASTGGVGLTTALVALRGGFVVVGSLPSSDGTSTNAKAGCLIVLDRHGHVVETFAGAKINGPWDMTALDRGNSAVLFVTNVLNGTVQPNANPSVPGPTVFRGTVLRITLSVPSHGAPVVTSEKVIARGFAERTDPAALVVGPTGVGLAANGTLYVADAASNGIAAVPDAVGRNSALGGGARTVSSGGLLNTPLGLAIAPNGDILSVNGGDGNLVETGPGGHQLSSATLTSAGGGALFGLAVAPHGRGVYFVNDADNTLDLFH